MPTVRIDDLAAQDAALDDELRAMYGQEQTNDEDSDESGQTEQDSPDEGTESAVNEHQQDLEESTLAGEQEQEREAMVPESRYHSAVVAMNKAQQELAERRKQDAERDSLITDLQSQVQQLTEAAESTKQADKASTQEANLDEDADLAEAKELFPEVINPLLKVIANLEKKLAAVSDDMGNVKNDFGNVKSVSDKYQEAERQAALDQHFSAIRSKHPDLDDLVKSESYADWYGNQGTLIQKLLQEGNAKEVVAALDLYRAEYPKESVHGDDKATTANKAAVKADKLAAARDASIPSVKTGLKPGQRQTFTNAEIAKMSITEYGKHADAIDAAMRRGDII